eukprot:scaffold155_cov347-Pavlova_lutheri.AAC.21
MSIFLRWRPDSHALASPFPRRLPIPPARSAFRQLPTSRPSPPRRAWKRLLRWVVRIQSGSCIG